MNSLLDDPNSMEAAIVAAVSAVLPTYPLVAPDQTLPPYAVYSGTKSAINQTLADGVPVENDKFEVAIYGGTFDEADQNSAAVRAAMVAIPAPSLVIFTMRADRFDMDVRMFRVGLEFSIWQSRVRS